MKPLLAVAFAVFALSGNVFAETWTTPDGFLSVTPPDSEAFTAVETPPEPFLGLWVTSDGAMRLAVMSAPYPAELELIQSSVEEGLAEEMGLEVIRLPSKHIAGHEVWQMAAKGEAAELRQAVVRHKGTAYKLMAVMVGEEGDPTTIDQFFDSLTISQPAAADQPQAPGDPTKFLDDEDAVNNLSGKIGGFAALLLIVLVIFLAARGKSKTTLVTKSDDQAE